MIHFSTVIRYHIISRVLILLVTDLSHWCPHITCNENKYPYLAFFLKSLDSFRCSCFNQALHKFSHVTQSVTSCQSASCLDKKNLNCNLLCPFLNYVLRNQLTCSVVLAFIVFYFRSWSYCYRLIFTLREPNVYKPHGFFWGFLATFICFCVTVFICILRKIQKCKMSAKHFKSAKWIENN